MRAVAPILLLALAGAARGEHRAALLIGDEPKALQAVADALGEFGFRCRSVPTPAGQRGIENVVESFAATTPTCGTALVYFHGRVAAAKSDGKPSLKLLESEGTRGGYDVRQLLEELSTRGGSRRHLVVINSSDDNDIRLAVPESCLVTYTSSDDWLSEADPSGDLLEILREAKRTNSNLPDDDVLTGRGSEALSTPDEFIEGTRAGDEWVNGRGVVFSWCPAGRYVAGSPEDEPGRYLDETQHEVVVGNGFWISKYELLSTQNLRNNGRPPAKSIARHKLHPLTMVNLDDARNMTTRSFTAEEQKVGRLPGDWQYSLPTEEEWEYAARAGTTSAYSFGDDPDQLPVHGNFADKTFYDTGDVYSNYGHRTLDDGVVTLARVGSYRPNPWGLHDVHGNVAEWCIGGAIRGGSWANTTTDCRVARRHEYGSRNEQNFIGYRLVIRRMPK